MSFISHIHVKKQHRSYLEYPKSVWRVQLKSLLHLLHITKLALVVIVEMYFTSGNNSPAVVLYDHCLTFKLELPLAFTDTFTKL